ncbi:MAG: hypothetical protein LBJ32_01730, partial [Oscillospiraceae bacterium]|nr:hypothetical protein [Oscillospiraceae bacterium]
NNFLKILAASLAVLNLFTNNFSLVNATENNISEKNSGNNTQKNIDKNNLVNNPKNVKNQSSKKKDIIKYTGFGIAAFLAVYSIVKKIKYIKLIKSIDPEKFPKSEEDLLKKFQQWFKDSKALAYDEKNSKDHSLEKSQALVSLCLISVHLARESLKTLSEGLDFGKNKGLNFIECSEFEVKIINTKSTLVFGYRKDPFQKCDENHKILVKVLGGLAPFFSCFSVTFGMALASFELKYFNSEKMLKINPCMFKDGNFRDFNSNNVVEIDAKCDENLKNILRYINDKKVILGFLDTLDKKLSDALKDPNTDFKNLLI